MKKVTVKINRKGETTVETDGFNGVGCKDVIKQVVAAMGAKELESTEKAEFFQVAETEKVSTTW